MSAILRTRHQQVGLVFKHLVGLESRPILGLNLYLSRINESPKLNNEVLFNRRYLSLERKLFQEIKVVYQPSSSQDWDPSISIPPYIDDRLSYTFGRSLKELKYNTLASMIEGLSKSEPHSTAVVVYDEGISKSFSDLNDDIDRLINGMINSFQLKRGDQVGVYSYNCYQFLLIQYACHKLGLVLNPMNPSYKSHEFNYVLGKSDVKVLFTTGKGSRQESLNSHWSVLTDQSLIAQHNSANGSTLKHVVILDGELSSSDFALIGVKISKWRDVFNSSSKPGLSKEIRAQIDQVRSDDIYGIYFTSGTTGFPKGATITQFNAINNTSVSCERVFIQRKPKFQALRPNICLPLPLFHEFAGVLGVLSPFINGGSFVLPGMRYSIQSVVESILRFRCNAIFLTPTILIDLLGYVQSNKITNLPLKTILIAGSSVMSELVHKTHKILPDLEELRIGYGSSENGVIASIQTTLESEETLPYTVGPPLDFTEIRIADRTTGDTTLIGQSGEVQTRGFNTMLCYYNDPERTNEVITKSRWYRTGDLGIIDKNGSLQIVGRIKDMIIKGGENIYPAEVETVLHQRDDIEDAHVFGIPDDRFGEEVCVWIKLKQVGKNLSKESEDQLKKDITDYCKKRLTYFKVPRHIMFVEEFPLTSVKKIKKFEMRAQTIKLLNQS